MEIPWRCAHCNHENMIDLDRLEEWRVDKLTIAQGFSCENCGGKQAIYAVSTSLLESEKKLLRYSPFHPQFKFLFAKLLRKEMGMLERLGSVNNGR